ncbi:ankyrin repeat domain-containing protein [Actinomycetospora lemnae]|uniref:Ankyrin repeat domain-containing protein n=1 Tax=Actinomycetospora lemnae TaxID=3019891 RepID=A0ABT5SRX8_9PSEU|nr:ankyrin repeat domain-containing protein [Actinomycetospora sp. DW7H6]MDD7965606.1 ankyrin repeat domain-containing protein [Actinomycetospora sp. DW7H6]
MAQPPDPSAPAPGAAAPGQAPVDEGVRELAIRVFGFAREGDAASLAQYVDAGVPVNLTNENGDTLVMLAAYHGHADAVSALVERGADVDRLNDRGQSPIAGAVFKGEEAVVRVLVAAGADPRAGHPTAVDSAVMFERQDLLTILTAP